MVTDREDWEKFLNKYEIPFTYCDDEHGKSIEIYNDDDNPNIGGYAGFCTFITFDKDEKFEQIQCWE